jgi:tripartite-type tricarboxylate transporter receptor subunit TctC
VVNAKPDGCTLLVNAAVLATFPSSFSKLGFDPVKDLAPVGGIGVTPTLLVAPKSLPAGDLKGLVQLSKQRPDGLSVSTAGYGLLQHLAVEEMAQRTGAKFVHVVYKGGAQAATDLIAARLDFGSFAAGSVIQFVKEGQLKPLAVVQETRSDLVPDVATTAEQGLPGLDAGVHFMLYAPAATPKHVVSVLNGELNKIVGDPALKQRFGNIGYDPTALTPDAAAAIMRKTGEVWAPVIKRLNIKLD